MSALLEATGLALAGRLQRCDVALRTGELTMLVGPNGAGKTTLLQAMAGISEAQGEVTIAGEALATASITRRSQLLSYLGASRDTRWPLLARDFVALGLVGRNRAARAEEALASIEALDFAGRRIDSLSTGERTRVMLARALAPGAALLLLDEPCANLDPKWQIAIIDRLRIEADCGAAVLVSVHDLDLALGHADRVIVMDESAIVADGDPRTALDPDRLAEVFGVERGADTRWSRI